MMLNRKNMAVVALFAALGILAIPGGPTPSVLLPLVNQLIGSVMESTSATALEERRYDKPAE